MSSLAEKFIALCKDNTFETSRRLLKTIYGIDIPTMTLHCYVRSQERYFDQGILEETAALFECGEMPEVEVTLERGRPLYLTIDEGLVREWSWYRKDHEEHRQKEFVCALPGVFFDGRKHISSKQAKTRCGLTNRYSHASATTDIDQFFSELVCLSYKRGYRDKAPLFILTDGARYLKERVGQFFPFATLLLDIFHLRQNIEGVISLDSPYWRHLEGALYTYDSRKLFRLVRNYVVTCDKCTERKRKLLGYIFRNRAEIDAHRTSKSRVHGSSAAEKAVDTLIARRFKRRGMTWTDAGVEVLLHFRVLAYNNKETQY